MILAPALLAAPAIARAASRLTRIGGGGGTVVGGSFIVGQPGGGALPPSLNTAYGPVSMGDPISPQPGYGGGTFCYGLLNGKEMAPFATAIGVFGLTIWQRLYVVDFGAGADAVAL